MKIADLAKVVALAEGRKKAIDTLRLTGNASEVIKCSFRLQGGHSIHSVYLSPANLRTALKGDIAHYEQGLGELGVTIEDGNT